MGFSHSLQTIGLVLVCFAYSQFFAKAGYAQNSPTLPTLDKPQPASAQPSPIAAPQTLPPLNTTFHCVQEAQRFATVAKRGNRTTPAMITWQDTSFGPEYTPEKRCQIVSDRLTQAVVENGGKLSNLQLSYGPLNGYPVVCYIRSREESCGSRNLLLTLRQDDRGKERQILAQILNFSVQGSGASITRGNPTVEPIAFGVEVERSLNPTLTPGALPDRSTPLGSFREEVERSFGSNATPRILPAQNTAPQLTSPNHNGKI